MRICLAFHPYPQLIPYLFNGSGFGPPVRVTSPSSWPWVDHLVSGLHPATESPYSDSLSLRLPYSVRLATECKSLTHYTKGMPSLLAELRPLVCMRFQDLFHSPPGVLSPFPHGTGSLSVDYEYLALEDGPPIFRQDFSCPALLVLRLVPHRSIFHTGLSPAMAGLSIPF